MNWEAIGATGEILGALAVVATLVYLATQVRYAKTAATDANRLARTTGVREMMIEFSKNDDLRRTWVKTEGLGDHYDSFAKHFDITPDEAARLDFQNLYWCWLHWGQYSSSKDHNDIKELENIVNTFYRTPSIQYTWNNTPMVKHMDPEFLSFVERVLSEDP